MEFPVTKDTKCTQNKAFIRWHDSPANMYGVRFHKEEQANQVLICSNDDDGNISCLI